MNSEETTCFFPVYTKADKLSLPIYPNFMSLSAKQNKCIFIHLSHFRSVKKEGGDMESSEIERKQVNLKLDVISTNCRTS